MKSEPELYLLVEGEPFLSACRDWQRRYIEARAAAFAFAKSLGADGWLSGFDSELVALRPVDPILEGWHAPAPKRRNVERRMVPVKGPKGDAARQAIAALPAMPKQAEIAALIGHPCSYAWRAEDGCGSGVMGPRFFNPVQLFWPTAEGPLLILCPDAEAHVARIRAERPGCVIERGEWTIPAGLTRISEARKDLLLAQARVRREEVAAAKAA